LIRTRRWGQKARYFGHTHPAWRTDDFHLLPSPSKWKRPFLCDLCDSSDPEFSRRGTGGENRSAGTPTLLF